MSAARCSPCDIFYPADRRECEACGNPTWQTDDDWDRDWEKQVAALIASRRARACEPIPNVTTTNVEKEGKSYIAEQLLIKAGYDPQPGGIVLVNNVFHELAALEFESTAIPAWRIVPVTLGEDFTTLPVLTDEQYETLNTERGLVSG